MGSWYWIGVSVGLGAAAGAASAGLVQPRGRNDVIALPCALAGIGVAIGTGVAFWQSGGWGDEVGAVVGGVLASLATAMIVAGALRRGGTRGGTAILVAGAAVVIAGIAFVPVAGYLEALALPALAARLRRTQPERYAGLRTLARD